MTITMLVVLVLSVVNISLMFFLTSKIIRSIKDNALLSRGRVVYEDESVGTLTAYEHDAILELVDGSVVVIPRMDEAHEEATG